MLRRDFLRLGLAAIAAPAIVRATSLMPVKAWFVDGVAFQAASHPSDLNEASLEAALRMTRGLVESMRQTRLVVEGQVIRRYMGHEFKISDDSLETIEIELKRSEAGLWYGSHGL